MRIVIGMVTLTVMYVSLVYVSMLHGLMNAIDYIGCHNQSRAPIWTADPCKTTLLLVRISMTTS